MKKLLLALLGGLSVTCFAETFPSFSAGVPHNQNESKFVEVYAHRGARSFSPENVIPGYKTGLAIGTNWVDMDIGVSKDGEIIVSHDIWLNPDIVQKDGKFLADSRSQMYKQLESSPQGLDVAVAPYLLKNMTTKQIQQYDVGSLNPKSPYAQYFPMQLAVPNTPMPTLAEVVKYVHATAGKNVKFQIEIKNDPIHPDWTLSPSEFASKLNTFIVKNKLVNDVEIQSFDWEPLYELHKLNPKIKLAFLVGYDDIERMQSTDAKQAGLWSGGKLLKDYNNSIPQMVKALGGSCYEPEDVSLTKEDLDEAHKLGLKVVVWTWPEHSGGAFNYQTVDKLINWCVDGIITDDPATLNAMLAARNMPIPKAYNK
jgi:glycerophosphoryl diester phosphodiesterase